MKTKNMTTLHLRNSSGWSPLRRDLLFIPLVIVCLAFSPTPNAFGVTPAPDGGYGGQNTAEGTDALFNRTTGIWNSAFGFRALYKNAAGSRNTAIGFQALYNNNRNFNSGDNVAIGANALFSNTTGLGNIAIGSFALNDNTSGSNNIAIGNRALLHFNEGSGYTVIGDSFYSNPTTVSIGRPSIVGDHCEIAWGVSTAYINAVQDIYVGRGTFGVCSDPGTARVHITATAAVYVAPVYTNPIAGSSVTINSDGELGVAPSSKRFKNDITPMDKASEAILALKPVCFRYKPQIDPDGTPQFGLVAEEVEKVNPDLVARDAEGKVFSVRYDAVNAMLLNEFLKEHSKVEQQERKVQEQEATIGQLRKGMEVLAAQLQEQASQIQNVSARLELAKPAAKKVINSRSSRGGT